MSDGARLFDAADLRFRETDAPSLPEDVVSRMDAAWSESVRSNPTLFDGPVVLCTALDEDDAGRLVLSWARASFRYRLVRGIPGAPSLASLFVSVVQPDEHGRVLVGRMSGSTTSPGLVQFPGGIMEPPAGGEPLDVASLRRHAARELREETGIRSATGELSLRWVVRRSNGNVGLVFVAPPRPEDAVEEAFATMLAADRADGREPELVTMALVATTREAEDLGGPTVDHLAPVLDRFLAGGPPHGG